MGEQRHLDGPGWELVGGPGACRFTSGRFTAPEWAEALGLALSESEAAGAPDTLESYYSAVAVALERLCEARGGISRDDRDARRAACEAAYLRTPHGRPVGL